MIMKWDVWASIQNHANILPLLSKTKIIIIPLSALTKHDKTYSQKFNILKSRRFPISLGINPDKLFSSGVEIIERVVFKSQLYELVKQLAQHNDLSRRIQDTHEHLEFEVSLVLLFQVASIPQNCSCLQSIYHQTKQWDAIDTYKSIVFTSPCTYLD